MSARRKTQPTVIVPRAIIRRSHPTVGERPRMIVKRDRRGVTPHGPHRPFSAIGRWLKSLLGVVALVGLIGATLWVGRSPAFEVSKIEVDGSSRVSAEAVAAGAGLAGANMFTADLAHAEEDIYAALPLIQSVTIRRDWPRTIRVTVQERRPWGTWEQGGVKYTIDRDGVVLGVAPGPGGAPAIRSSEPGSRQQGDRVNSQAVDSAAQIYESLPAALGTEVTEVAFVAGKGVQVTTADGQSALFGDSSSIAYKISVWSALAKEAQVRGINYTTIDLRFGNRPVLQ